MLVMNPTKKTLPLFSHIEKVDNEKSAKHFSKINPFYSWHANYVTVNRKKVLFLVNELTFLPVVLADINATEKKQLDAHIQDGIQLAFQMLGIPKGKIRRYFENARSIKVNKNHNRTISSIVNNYIYLLEYFPLDWERVPQVRIMAALNDHIFSSNDYKPADETTRMAFENHLDIVDNEFKEEETEFVDTSFKANTNEAIAAFGIYLKEELELSDKVVKRHNDNANLYVQELLVYRSYQPDLNELDFLTLFLNGYIVDKGIVQSQTGVQQMGTSLKKYYRFLADAHKITASQHKEIKDVIGESVEAGKSLFIYTSFDIDY